MSSAWTPERRIAHSEKMKARWASKRRAEFSGCPKCGEPDITKFAKNKAKRFGVQVYCRICQDQYQRLSETLVSPEQVEAALKAQQNRCAICRKEFKKTPHADHNHTTGKFRGMLCPFCNLRLGWLENDPEWLDLAKEYLSKA